MDVLRRVEFSGPLALQIFGMFIGFVSIVAGFIHFFFSSFGAIYISTGIVLIIFNTFYFVSELKAFELFKYFEFLRTYEGKCGLFIFNALLVIGPHNKMLWLTIVLMIVGVAYGVIAALKFKIGYPILERQPGTPDIDVSYQEPLQETGYASV